MMPDHLPDFCERGEARVEAWQVDNVIGRQFRCGCGKWCDLRYAETLSPDPYAIPVCPVCFAKACDEKYGPGWREKMDK